MGRFCRNHPGECRGEDLPPCALLLQGSTGEELRRVAARLRGEVARVERHWRALAASESEAPPGADLGGELREFLERLAVGDPVLVTEALRAEGRDLRRQGITLQETLGQSQRFADACMATLEELEVGAEARASARRLLERLGVVRFTLQTCQYVATGTGAAEEGAAPGPAPLRSQFCGLVGASPPMQRLYHWIERAARGRETILVTGESGTGKELVARAIHSVSGDPAERFVAVNCAALPRDLLESELFGHRRGAFSGALEASVGLVRAAAGGTLFLDEIAELPVDAQAKLLRVIQERAVRGVGEAREVSVEVRIVAATNQSPAHLIEAGRLRRDLYYRLQRIVIEVPALRSHREDLPLLVEHLAHRWQRETGSGARAFSDAALERLGHHDWPGNVRELENAVFAACAAAPGPLARLEDLPPLGEAPARPLSKGEEPVRLVDAERAAIAAALDRTRGNKSSAARMLGISRKQLYVKIREYGLST